MGNVTIEKIEIVSFGKLKMLQVSPKSGINLLSAPNESGKSTLAAFIRFMFYGYTGGRVQSIIDNDKKLYTPWDNPQSEGALYIKTDDGRYKIERKYLQSGKETLEVFETHTGRLLNTGVQPGEHFFGVNDVTFEKTSFFRQLTIPSGKDEYIAEQLQNISMSADEQTNTKKALKRLTDARNMLSGRGKSGLIPKLEAERDELEKRLADASETNRMIQELSDKIAESKRLITDNSKILGRLNSERENISKFEAAQRLTQIHELERTEQKAKAEYEEVKKNFKNPELPDNTVITSLLTYNASYKTDLRNKEKAFEAITAEESELENLQKNFGTNRENAESLKKQVKSKNLTKIVFIIFAGLSLLGGIGLIVLATTVIGLAVIGLAVVLAVPAFIISTSLKKLLKSHGVKSLSELEALMSNYPLTEQRIADKKAKLTALNTSYSELLSRIDEAKNKMEAGISEYITNNHSMTYEEQIEFISNTAQKIKQKFEVYKVNNETRVKATENMNLETLSAEAFGAVRPEREKVKVDNEINFYGQQKQIFENKERDYERQKAMLEGKGGDPAVILGKRDAITSKLEDYKKKYASLDLAVMMLSEASDYMKSTVAPRINQYASEFFGSATNNKYKTISVDTTMAMNFEDVSGTKSCDYLSAGTRDSAYLCLRFALIKLLYGGVNPPIILDDAFGRLDDERLDALLNLIASAGINSQSFILTCGDREQKLLEQAGIKYNSISL